VLLDETALVNAEAVKVLVVQITVPEEGLKIANPVLPPRNVQPLAAIEPVVTLLIPWAFVFPPDIFELLSVMLPVKALFIVTALVEVAAIVEFDIDTLPVEEFPIACATPACPDVSVESLTEIVPVEALLIEAPLLLPPVSALPLTVTVPVPA
jgi:hypothetical protein